jgi:hypothetical protein
LRDPIVPLGYGNWFRRVFEVFRNNFTRLAPLALVPTALVDASMNRSRQSALAAPVAVAALLMASGAICAGTASGSGVPWGKSNSCPDGYQLDGNNSQRCISRSPAGPETAATGCTTPGFNLTGSSPDTCVDANGRDTFGNQH